MKTRLLAFVLLLSSLSFAQPQIMGDLILCPEGEGTAYVTTDQNYDSYQWYFKYWFGEGDFMAIPGATGPSFTYDWNTFDQALLKVVVTLDGETFESNTIQIDSYAFLPISMGFEDSENISIDMQNGNVLLCTGTTFNIEVFSPYSANIQWYRNGVAIGGANEMTYEVSAEGVYHVVAATDVCPEFTGTTQGTPIIVAMNDDCNLGTPEENQLSFSIVPNPASDRVTISASEQDLSISIFDLTGKLLIRNQNLSATVDISSLASGVYIVMAEGLEKSAKLKLIKQ